VAATLIPRRFQGRTVADHLARLLGSPEVARACRAVAAWMQWDEWEGPACQAVEELAGEGRAVPRQLARAV
jgi:hypothetical protein